MDLTPSEMKALKDASFTHNHPGGSGFSEDDLRTAITGDVAEMRVVTKAGTFIIEKPDSGWHRGLFFEFQKAEPAATSKILDGFTSGKYKSVDEADSALNHEQMLIALQNLKTEKPKYRVERNWTNKQHKTKRDKNGIRIL